MKMFIVKDALKYGIRERNITPVHTAGKFWGGWFCDPESGGEEEGRTFCGPDGLAASREEAVGKVRQMLARQVTRLHDEIRRNEAEIQRLLFLEIE